MKNKQQRFTPLTGLRFYISQTQASFARNIANAKSLKERQDEQVTCEIMLWEADLAQKYRLTQSALAMIRRLMPEKSQGIIKTLPGTGIWMSLEDEKWTNVYFTSIPHAATSYLEKHKNAKMPDKLEPIVKRPWVWDMEIMARGDHPLTYLYDTEQQHWTLNKVDLCPVHHCEKISVDTRGWPSWYICDVCKPTFDYWTSWFPVALMAVNMDFAETEEKQKPVTLTEKDTRKRTDKGHHKAVQITYSYQVITFDISVKTHAVATEPIEHKEPTHPTWLELAIADDTVLYVDKHIEQTQRTFRHERYVNMRGKTITVQPYDKRIPISVKRLKQTIYQAVASKP